jgi:hypothetical protein
VNSTSSVALAAMPVAGQLSGTGARLCVLTAKSRLPSGATAVTSAWVSERAPEQYCLVPSSRQPPWALLAISLGPGGCAAQTPHRLPAGGLARTPSSARMARAWRAPVFVAPGKVFPGQVGEDGPALAGCRQPAMLQVQPARLDRFGGERHPWPRPARSRPSHQRRH